MFELTLSQPTQNKEGDAVIPDRPAKSYTPIRHVKINQKKYPDYKYRSHSEEQPTIEKSKSPEFLKTLHAVAVLPTNVDNTPPLLILNFLQQINHAENMDNLVQHFQYKM